MSLAADLLNRRELVAILEDSDAVEKLTREGYHGPDVEVLRESVDHWVGQCGSLRAHVARSTRPNFVGYSGLLSMLTERLATRPSRSLLRLLESHANHSKTLLRRILSGSSHEQYLERATCDLGFALLEGSSGEKFKSKHSKFIEKLKAEYDVEPEFIEYMNDGIFLNVSQEDHAILRDAEVRQFANQHNYILLKRGDPGQEEIKWGFVYCGTLGGTEKLSEGRLPKGWTDHGSPFMRGGKWYVNTTNRTTLEEGQYCFETSTITKTRVKTRRGN